MGGGWGALIWAVVACGLAGESRLALTHEQAVG